MLEPGTQIGRYEVHRRLGRGGMGSVYVAHDPVLGRMVAIKVFAGELDFPDARERFSREARSAAALSHPNIVTVYDFGEFAGQPFIVMEYVPGETLAGVIRRKALVSVADKLRWIEELCGGAGYAHQMSVIHRDIKPANLMVDRAGRLKILDFGIARVMGVASKTTSMIGTPGYMAPEQIEGRTVDHRADLFSIGVVSYELLAYTEAFPGDTVPAITHRILSEDPVPLPRVIGEIDPAIVTVIDRALKKDVTERFEDAESMRAAIARIRRQVESEATLIRPPDPSRRETPLPGPGRGTGSARRPSGDAVGVAALTPPPQPKHTDPEALARLRVAYFETALESARTLLDTGQLNAALDACHQARIYDETHAGALELERRIKTAMLTHDGMAEEVSGPRPVAFDPAVLSDGAVAADGSPSPFTTSPSVSEARNTPADRTVLRVPLPRVPRAPSEPANVWPSEPTIIAPPRRTPLPPQTSPDLLRPQPESKTPKPPRPDIRARLRALVAVLPSLRLPSFRLPSLRLPSFQLPSLRLPSFQLPALKLPAFQLPAFQLRQLSRHTTLMWGGVGLLAIAAVAAGILIRTTRPAPVGTLILDAVPWATVSEITSQDGEPQPLPSPASTPLALTLPEGSYQVVFVGPPPESQQQRVTVRVDAQTAPAVPIVRFRTMTAEEYFEQYLASPSLSAAPAGDAAAPPVEDSLSPAAPSQSPVAAPPAARVSQ